MRGPLALLDDAWSRTRRHLTLFVLIYLPPTAAALVLGYASAMLFPQAPGGSVYLPYDPTLTYGVALVVFVAAVVVSLVGSLALLKAIMDPSDATFTSAYRFGLAHFWGFLLLSFLVGLATFIGLMAFIIPGIVVAVWFVFSQFLFVERGLRGTKAMRASYERVRGKWWRIFGRLVALTVLMIVIYIAIGTLVSLVTHTLPGTDVLELLLTNAAGLVLTPLAIAYLYGMYRDTAGE